MKSYFIFIVFTSVVVLSSTSFGQFDPSKLLKKKVEKKVKKEVEKTIDKGLEDDKQISQDNESKKETSGKDTAVSDHSTQVVQSQEKLKLWSKYDFVAGDKVIFADDLSGEESGEFPSRWDLRSGSAQNATLGKDNVIQFVHSNTIIFPLMNKENYLPDVFTLEFDIYFEEQAALHTEQYQLRFFNGAGGSELIKGSKNRRFVINIALDKVTMSSFGGRIDEYSIEKRNWKPKWKHIAVSFNKRSLKLYMDKERVLNIPNLGYKPESFSIGSYFYERFIKICAIKDIRVNEGGKKLYDRILSDGKFVTRGILFEVNKSIIREKSMGTINDIVKLMNEHSELRFRIEGHTDSDGENGFNQKLSEERAAAVKSLLVNSGIDNSRLETKGYGESKPVDNNTTPEGKANNRRVEFIKL